MNAKHQFKYTYNEGCEDFSPCEITFDMPGDVTIPQMLWNFECYLKACGFVFDGHLEIAPEDGYDLEEDDTSYGCMADFDKEDGLESTSLPKDKKWIDAEKKVKEFNEAIARLDNEQLQKAYKEACKMSGLHEEAIKDEVKKNKWVHGMCNPPSPDWKKNK